MSIYMRDLSPLAYGALENLSTARDWVDIQPYMEPEPVAWLVYRLEVEPDNEDYFPSGKWATIQRLQEMLRKEAALEHDIARHIQITAEQAQEMEKLRQDLDATSCTVVVGIDEAKEKLTFDLTITGKLQEQTEEVEVN